MLGAGGVHGAVWIYAPHLLKRGALTLDAPVHPGVAVSGPQSPWPTALWTKALFPLGDDASVEEYLKAMQAVPTKLLDVGLGNRQVILPRHGGWVPKP